MIELGEQSLPALVRRARDGGLSFAPLSDFDFKMRTGYYVHLLSFSRSLKRLSRVAGLPAQGLPCDLREVQIQ